MVASLD